ncbi:interferon phi 2 isoform X1 [Mobula hypostoma]|uniref:interferon phi 2 isoform X1 n=1 Tax=Mobula hypostoma TaxID=723540 RepID=UPI002FC322D1
MSYLNTDYKHTLCLESTVTDWSTRAVRVAVALAFCADHPAMWFHWNWGGRLPRQCATERLSLKTKPLDLVKLSAEVHAQERIWIVHQTLHHLRRIYSLNLSSVTWVQSSVEHFRHLLDRQLKELDVCVRKPGSESKPRKNAAILKYFQKLREFLKQKGFSNCAWEVTRTETTMHLKQLLLIMAKISRDH